MLGKHVLLFFIPGSSCFLYKFPSDSFNEIPLTIELITSSASPFLIFTASLCLLFNALAPTRLEKMLLLVLTIPPLTLENEVFSCHLYTTQF